MRAIVSVQIPSPHIRWSPVFAAENVILLVASFIAVVDNLAFWRAVLQGRDLSSALTWGSAVLTFVLLTAVYYVVLASISTRETLKAVLCTSLLIGALVAHYVARYGIVIDTSMMRNVLQTDDRGRGAGRRGRRSDPAAVAVLPMPVSLTRRCAPSPCVCVPLCNLAVAAITRWLPP